MTRNFTLMIRFIFDTPCCMLSCFTKNYAIIWKRQVPNVWTIFGYLVYGWFLLSDTKWIYRPTYSAQIMKKYGRYGHLDDHLLQSRGVPWFSIDNCSKGIGGYVLMIQFVHLSQKRNLSICRKSLDQWNIFNKISFQSYHTFFSISTFIAM